MTLFAHQLAGISFLQEREGALLAYDMGTGKSRTALIAARRFFDSRGKNKIDRVLVLAPASVKFAWREEINKLACASSSFHTRIIVYKNQEFICEQTLGSGEHQTYMPVAIISYSLLQQERHAALISKWCAGGRTVLICDESSYLKNRTAKQTKGAKAVAEACAYRWLLSGTPVTNSPLDLWSQAEVMYPLERGKGPLHGFLNWYAFRASFAELQLRRMGQHSFTEVIGYKNINKLQKRFDPFISRVEKKDCLDLPDKVWTVREVALGAETWKLYCELKKDCLLSLGNGEVRPEPNAAVRLLRLSQLTSGHVGATPEGSNWEDALLGDILKNPSDKVIGALNTDISSEKLSWLVEALTEGELANERATIIWCRWRRERERLHDLLLQKQKTYTWAIYGGQSEKVREDNLKKFKENWDKPSVLLAQPHAGGFGLNLTNAHTAVYMSNDYSWSVRAQSEDRMHRSGQVNKCLYIDVLATGPKGERTIDHTILAVLKEKKDLASMTCSQWKKALE